MAVTQQNTLVAAFTLVEFNYNRGTYAAIRRSASSHNTLATAVS